jgi:hypothetical protein
VYHMQCGHIVFEWHVERGSPCQFCHNCDENKACNYFSGEEREGLGVSRVSGNRESIRCVHPLQNFTKFICSPIWAPHCYAIPVMMTYFISSYVFIWFSIIHPFPKMHFPKQCIL